MLRRLCNSLYSLLEVYENAMRSIVVGGIHVVKHLCKNKAIVLTEKSILFVATWLKSQRVVLVSKDGRL
jgi:hypothetical protein